MRIAVIADTHDRLPAHVLAAIRDADEIWHLGDVTTRALLAEVQQCGPPVRIVRGNCDSCPDWPETVAFEIEGFSVLLVHIPPKRAPAGVDLLFHGHTHVPRNERVGTARFYNPGCITRPNRGAPASYAWLTLQRGALPEWELRRI